MAAEVDKSELSATGAALTMQLASEDDLRIAWGGILRYARIRRHPGAIVSHGGDAPRPFPLPTVCGGIPFDRYPSKY